ncbi:peptide/nickel transport system permease protein [Alkalispirillum mobile]|uniref:Peptide/nickel transport system permease protein n=1 Tax=Alkalispirillum mobile TaxID=85925 RepID=A0A498BTW3_9GAMM|nr:ABC transporter permease [Alkalispirillum mobile]RLK46842.1 peptide/nickel transport system permease protein [Alkalispirillum mobile]
MRRWLEGLKQLRRYPSAVLGTGLILFLIGLAVYTVVAIPYSQALDLWRGGEQWRMHPVNASPVWTDRLRGGDLPETQIISSADVTPEEQPFPGGRRLRIPLSFDYDSSAFPSEINLFLAAEEQARAPFVRLIWQAPDGREEVLGGRRMAREERISISQDWALERRLGHIPHVGLMLDPETADRPDPAVLQGTHTLLLDVVLFDENAGLDADLVVYGRVHGVAGTDHQRRDLMVALMWGTPVALAFGLLAAVGTTVTTLVIAAMGVWYRGWVDAVIQRLTEVNMILPMLPILVMVGTLYSTSIWLMLGVVVALGIFSAGIKMYRAMLLPIREAPYIEAAKAYGASNARIILRYMVPRVLPVLIPTFVTLIPTFVFLEASLAVLGLGDPVLPTWGKVLNDAQEQSALYNGFYYWVLSPAFLLMLTGLGFAMLGFALDRVFNPRLRNL